jgi:hypothetical protein
MALKELKEHKPETAFSGVLGRTFDVSSYNSFSKIRGAPYTP